MSILFTLIWFLVALGILVTFHEFGHFYVARRCGVKVLRFSIGFGKPLLSWYDRHGTEFVIAAIPLGGYVKMLDEREGDVPAAELPMAFTQKTVWQRMAIVSAGPIANFILAIGFYFVLALLGPQGIAPVVGEVSGFAQRAGIQPGDEIVAVDGKRTPTWNRVNEQLIPRIGDTGQLALTTRTFNQSDAEVTHRIPLTRWLGDSDKPDLLADLGITPEQPVISWVIARVASDSPAQRAGIKEGDRLVMADGEPLTDWQQWVDYVRQRSGQTIELTAEREGQTKRFSVVPELVNVNGQQIAQLGIMPRAQWPDEMKREENYTFPEALVYGFQKTWQQSLVILSFLKKLILLDVSIKNMGGTLTIAQVAGDTAAAGLVYYLGFLAFFSVSLGVFNLLPIPVLDGGHLLFYSVEAISGKPLPEKIQLLGYQLGLTLIVSIMIVAHYNDFVRLFS